MERGSLSADGSEPRNRVFQTFLIWDWPQTTNFQDQPLKWGWIFKPMITYDILGRMHLHDYKLFWCEQKGIRMGCSCGMLLWEVLRSRSCKTLYKVLVSRSCKILFEALVWRSCRGSSRCFPPGFLSGKQFWSLWVLYHVISCIFHALKQPCLVVQWLTIILSFSHKCFTVNIIEHTKIHSFLSSYRFFFVVLSPPVFFFNRHMSPLKCCDQIHPFCWTSLNRYLYIHNIPSGYD